MRKVVSAWDLLQSRVVACGKCPRLREHCLETAGVKRAAFSGETYWGRPVPNFAPPDPSTVRLLIVGLAPAAHGANRTGRMFTGDRSGDFLFRAMFETGFATQPTSVRQGDGLELIACAITAACRCAPPANKPTPLEIENCRPYLDETLRLLPGVRGLMALGRIGWDAAAKLLIRAGGTRPMDAANRPAAFAHGAVGWSDNPSGPRRFLIGSYHPSQQNTFTGKLTPAMLKAVFEKARELAG